MKRLKKIMLLVMAFNMMLFAVDSNKRQADASVAGLTAAAIATAASIPLSTVLLGVAGLAAVGAAVYYADDVVRVGTMMVGNLTQDEVAEMVNETDGTVKLSAKAVDAAANSAMTLPRDVEVSNSKSYSMSHLINSVNQVVNLTEMSMPVLDELNGFDLFNIQVSIKNTYTYSSGTYLRLYNSSGVLIDTHYKSMLNGESVVSSYNVRLTASDMPVKLVATYNIGSMIIDKVEIKDLTVPVRNEKSKTLENAPTTVRGMQEHAVTNNVVNNTMTIPTEGDLTGVTVDNLLTTSTENLNESIIQTGILSKIWDTLKNLPSKIAAAFVSLFTGLQNHLSGLWEDAGLVWSGMAEKIGAAKGVLDNILTGIMDNVSGGIDNLKIGLDNLLSGLSAGIDSLSGVLNGWGESLRNGIDSLSGAIATGWGNIMDGLNSVAEKIAAGVGSIVGTITNAFTDLMTWLLDLPQAIAAIFLPPAFDPIEERMNQTGNRLNYFMARLTAFTDLLTTLFGNAKSIYDLTINIKGKDYFIVPIALKSGIDAGRSFFTGTFTLFVGTILYNRSKRMSWWKGG